MQIRREILDEIVRGDIDLVFRRWTKTTVRTHGAVTDDDGLSALHKRLARLDANDPWDDRHPATRRGESRGASR